MKLTDIPVSPNRIFTVEYRPDQMYAPHEDPIEVRLIAGTGAFLRGFLLENDTILSIKEF